MVSLTDSVAVAPAIVIKCRRPISAFVVIVDDTVSSYTYRAVMKAFVCPPL